MKFKQIKTAQTANGLGFEDDAGNVWQAAKFYNVTSGQVVLLPMTVDVCKATAGTSARHEGLKVIDTATYQKWANTYRLSAAPIKVPLLKKVITYVRKETAKLHSGSHKALQTQDRTKASYV